MMALNFVRFKKASSVKSCDRLTAPSPHSFNDRHIVVFVPSLALSESVPEVPATRTTRSWRSVQQAFVSGHARCEKVRLYACLYVFNNAYEVASAVCTVARAVLPGECGVLCHIDGL